MVGDYLAAAQWRHENRPHDRGALAALTPSNYADLIRRLGDLVKAVRSAVEEECPARRSWRLSSTSWPTWRADGGERMPVDRLWRKTKRGPDGEGLRTARYGRGKRRRVGYLDDASVRRERFFAKRPEAERFDAAVRTDVARGLFVDPAAGPAIVEEYAPVWWSAQMHRGSTSELVERTFKRHIFPTLGRIAIGKVRPSHIQAWAKKVDLAPSTARVAYSYLVSIFNAAVRDRAIATTPRVGVTLPALPRSEHLILRPEQVHALAEALPARYRALVYVGAGLGLRHGEALGLELEHVDFLRREVHVAQQLTVTTGRQPFLAPPKTKTSYRTVELPKVTADALARHLERLPVHEVSVMDETDPRNPRERAARLLFTTEQTRRPVHRATWSGIWAPAARAVGLPHRTGFHALRTYFATLLIFGGANVKTVQLALGHSTPTVTLNTHVGLWPGQVDRTRALVDAPSGPR